MSNNLFSNMIVHAKKVIYIYTHAHKQDGRPFIGISKMNLFINTYEAHLMQIASERGLMFFSFSLTRWVKDVCCILNYNLFALIN